MFAALAKRIFGSANDRYVKGLSPIVSAVNDLEPSLEALSDEDRQRGYVLPCVSWAAGDCVLEA